MSYFDFSTPLDWSSRLADADIYKDGTKAATFTAYDDYVEFRYVDGYEGPPIASTLPNNGDTYVAAARQLPPYFSGLLPEGRRLSALRRSLKVAPDDDLTLLVTIGSDTVGDVQVVPSGTRPTDPTPLVDDWGQVNLEERFAASISAEPDAVFDPVAIAGIQDKMSGKAFSFPETTATSGPVIVKLNPEGFQHGIVAEHAMLNVATVSPNLTVPRHTVVTDAAGRRGLVIERFDRNLDLDTSTMTRTAVEDGCQAMDRYPADKYSLDTFDVIAALAQRCAAPGWATLQLLERFLLSYVVCDGDLHARNLAIYRNPDTGLWEPSPVFDVAPTVMIGDVTLAAPFAGNTVPVGRERFLDATDTLGVPRHAVEHLIDKAVPAIREAAVEALDTEEFGNAPRRDKAIRAISTRAERLVSP